MEHPLEHVSDVVATGLGVMVASCPWTQVLTGIEAVFAGLLTIVLLSLRIWLYIRRLKKEPRSL